MKQSEHKNVVETAADVVETIDRSVEETVKMINKPIRRSVFSRFPTLFTILPTVGVVATFLGIEMILEQYNVLADYPWVMLLFGIGTLVLTGTLYRKLG
ncbi:MAG: hypothetical protein AAGA35_01485 [Patescibacteria group bacterium]